MQAMQTPKIDKLTLNIGMGAAGETLQNAKYLLEKITGRKAVITKAKARNPTWKIKAGDNIGTKVTIRGKAAEELLKKALDVVEFTIPEKSFDNAGNVAFGIKEYIDFPGMKYDPKVGMMGFDVCITLKKPGARISLRRITPRRIPRKQKVSKEDAINFMKTKFSVNVSIPQAAE